MLPSQMMLLLGMILHSQMMMVSLAQAQAQVPSLIIHQAFEIGLPTLPNITATSGPVNSSDTGNCTGKAPCPTLFEHVLPMCM